MTHARPVRRFVGALGRLFLLTACVAAAILVAPPANDYFAAYGDKLDRLERMPGPRLVLVGGSGLAFGVDSATLERALGRPTLNLGLHAGLGLEFMLAHAERYLRPGDVIVVVPEYGTLDDDGAVDEGLQAAALLSAFPSALRHGTLADVGPVVRGFPDFALHTLVADRASAFRQRRAGEYVYARAAFDERGDEVGHRAAPRPGVPLTMRIAPSVARHVAHLASWSARVEARGAHVVRLYPTIPRQAALANEPALRVIEATIRASSAPFVGEPLDATLPDDAFFDTPNHLDGRGVELATERIRAQLDRSVPALAP